MAEKIPPERNGNDIKTALERAEDERREREIKTIEKHLRENGGNEDHTEPHTKAKNPRTRKTGKVRHQRFSPRNETTRDYDEDGRPVTQLESHTYSAEPEIKREPELSRKRSRTKTPSVSSVADVSDFIQVETDPAKMANVEKQPESVIRPPRIRPNVVPVDEGPFVQVETKKEFGNAEVKPPQTAEPLLDFNFDEPDKPTVEAEAVVPPPETIPVSEGEVIAQSPETPAERFSKRAAEVEKMLEGHRFSADEMNPVEESRMYMNFGREAQAMEVLENAARKIADGTYVASAQSPETVGVRTAGETPIVLDSEDAPEYVKNAINSERPDGTQDWRDKWREKLSEAVGKVVGGTKEKFDWYKSSKEGLIRRNVELDAQGEKIGGLDGERLFRKIGEWYNKRDWKTKLAVGAILGLGATIGVGVSVPLAYACLSGIAVQRLAGFATMYMKFEKQSHDETWGKNKEWGKQKAMLKAGVYTVLMGLAIKEAIEYASGTELAHSAQAKVEGWLGAMLGYQPSVPQSAPALEAKEPVLVTEAVVPPALEPAPEPAVATAETQPPAPATTEQTAMSPETVLQEVEIKATPGKGYEWMAKRLIENSQIKSISPTYYGLQSDVTRLLYAQQEGNLNKVLHDIATEKGWFNPSTGESAQINLNQKISFDKHGILQISNSETFESPPDGAPVTPPYPVEPISVRPPPPELRAELDARFAVVEHAPSAETESTRSMPISHESPAEVPTPVVEPQAPSAEPSAEPLPNVKVPEPEVYKTIDLPPEQEAVARASETVTASPDSVPTVPSNVAELGSHGFINDFGTPINPDVANFYSSPKGVYLFGGEVSDVQAQEYAVKNNISVFVDKSFKNWLGWTTNRVVEYVPTESGPPAMVIHNGSSLVPDPKNFTKRIF